jgi:hypothetical protein
VWRAWAVYVLEKRLVLTTRRGASQSRLDYMCLLSPTSPYKEMWDWFIILIVIYSSVLVPFQVRYCWSAGMPVL